MYVCMYKRFNFYEKKKAQNLCTFKAIISEINHMMRYICRYTSIIHIVALIRINILIKNVQ